MKMHFLPGNKSETMADEVIRLNPIKAKRTKTEQNGWMDEK